MTMNRLKLLLLLLLIPVVSKAEFVDKNRAQRFALDFINSRTTDIDGVLETVPVYNGDVLTYYIVNLKPEGWVLVSADDAVSPLLGYNTTEHFEKSFIKGNIATWMDYYSVQIVDAIKAHDKSLPGWDNGSKKSTRASSDIVEPLIKVNWNQGSPYNQFCPMDGDKHSVVGCVAVGMAQAMSVARWPNRPTGQFAYYDNVVGNVSIDYDKEDAYNWNKIIAGDDNKVWVAHLLYHCGVAVKMQYSADGSGTFTSQVPNALKRNFSYPNSVSYYSRDNYSLEEWKQMMVDELKAGRAVIYSAYDSKGGYGHCFNLDGYDGSAMFHVNWGWGGSGNGYFTVDGLKDTHMNMNYDSRHAAVLGVRGPTTAPIDIKLSSTTVMYDVAVGTAFSTVTVETEVESTSCSITIKGSYNFITKKNNSVPFSYSTVKKALVTTEALTKDKEYSVIVTATNKTTKEKLEKSFTITAISDTEVKIVEDEPVSVDFFSLSGVKVSAQSESELAPGAYIKVSESKGKKTTSKVVVR